MNGESADEGEEAAWDGLVFVALDDRALADRLARSCAASLVSIAELREEFVEVAASQVVVSCAVADSGLRLLRVGLPLGAGIPEYEWDGTIGDAEHAVHEAAATAARTIRWERDLGLLTGWER